MKETITNKILALHEEGFTPYEMWKEAGLHYGTVYSILAKNKLKPNNKQFVPALCPKCGHDLIKN